MSAFTKHFLRERRGGLFSWGRGPGVFLGAFGKHPGWDDHMDDLGLETESLTLAKQSLYVEGIGGLVNSGAWEHLPEEGRLPCIWHAFLWWRGENRSILGRLWSSADRKGRERYPMAVALQAENVPEGWLLGAALDGLETLEAACRATDAAGEVRALLDAGRAEFRRSAALAGEEQSGELPALPPPWPAAWGEGAPNEPGGEREAALRTLYRAGHELASFAPRQPGGSGEGTRARAMRLPGWAGERPGVSLDRWQRVFSRLLDPEAPALLLLPLEGDWVDLIVGEPVSDDFLGLRAAPSALPPASAVPYKLGAEWQQCAGDLLARAERGEAAKATAAAFWRASADG